MPLPAMAQLRATNDECRHLLTACEQAQADLAAVRRDRDSVQSDASSSAATVKVHSRQMRKFLQLLRV